MKIHFYFQLDLTLLPKLLVDCEATTQIVSDESKFINFDNDFNSENHFIVQTVKKIILP